jgi:hypothetical protein
MKRFLYLAVGLAGLALSGCVLTSVSPYYTEKDTVFEAGLIGEWVDPNEPGARWRFERQGDKAYRLTHTEEGKSKVSEARVFKLRDQLFLDLYDPQAGEDGVPPAIPSHYLLRVLEIGPGLRVAPLKYDWLQEYLEANPKALRHFVIPGGDQPADRRLVLTGDTAELQAFVIQQLNNRQAWKDEVEFKRVTP